MNLSYHVVSSSRSLIPNFVLHFFFFFFQAEDGIRDIGVTGVQTCALPIYWYTVALPVDDEATITDLVSDLVGLGARVHAVEPGRISLEERLLGILRDSSEEDRKSVV